TLRPSIDWILDVQGRLAVQSPTLGKRSMGKMLLRLAHDRTLRKLLGRMLTASAFEIIGETFESDAMRGLWAFWTSMSIPADAEGTGLYLSSFGAVHRGGVHRPVGGMSSLIEALTAFLEHHGGAYSLGRAVESILVEHNRAAGVRLDDGSILHARRGVLASCAPQITLGKLL